MSFIIRVREGVECYFSSSSSSWSLFLWSSLGSCCNDINVVSFFKILDGGFDMFYLLDFVGYGLVNFNISGCMVLFF